jgi:hypothetical protein
MAPYISSSSPLMLDRQTYCNLSCNGASTRWYTMDNTAPLDHRKPPEQALLPDALGRSRTCASKLLAGTGQRFEAAPRLYIFGLDFTLRLADILRL